MPKVNEIWYYDSFNLRASHSDKGREFVFKILEIYEQERTFKAVILQDSHGIRKPGDITYNAIEFITKDGGYKPLLVDYNQYWAKLNE